MLLGEMLHEPAAIPLVVLSWLSLNILLGWREGAMFGRWFGSEGDDRRSRSVKKRGTRRGGGALAALDARDDAGDSRRDRRGARRRGAAKVDALNHA